MDSIAHLVHVYGLVTVAAIVGLECIGIPSPGETALLAAAVYAGTKHDFNIVAVILTAGGAATVGRMIGYAIGRRFGYRLLLHYGKYVGMTTSRIKLGQYLFLRHGGKIMFAAQFVPVLRTFAGLFAGANVMPWRSCLITNAAGSMLWAAIYGYAAYELGREFEQMEGPVVIILAIVTAVSVVAGAVFVKRHEAELSAEAERAMPGPLLLP
jgi:membrane protein DedA with SNARE-associated domain